MNIATMLIHRFADGFFCAGLYVSALLLAIASSGLAADVTNESASELKVQIEQAWQNRFEKLNSVELTIDVEETLAKGFHSSIASALLEGNNSPKNVKPVPDRDSVVKTRWTIVIDGPKTLVESVGPMWDIKTNSYRKFNVKTAFNGKDTRKLQEVGNSEYPLQGYIMEASSTDHVNLVQMRPLAIWLGPLWGLDVPISVSDGHAQSDPSGTKKLVQVFDEHSRVKMWLDPLQAYSVVRLAKEGESLEWQIDVSNDEQPDGLWIPSQWTFSNLGFGGGSVMRCKLSDVKINSIVNPDKFKIVFEPSTLVCDFTGGKSREYILGENGTEESVFEHGMKGDNPAGTNWFLFGNIVLVLVLGALSYIRARRTR